MYHTPFLQFLQHVDGTELSDQMCTQCLSSPWGDKFEVLHFKVDIAELSNVVATTEILIQSKDKAYFDDISMDMRRVATVCLSIIKNSSSPNAQLTAMRQLLLLGLINGSKGRGISTPGVLEHITSTFIQIAIQDISGRTVTASSTDLDMEEGSNFDEEAAILQAIPTTECSIVILTAKAIVHNMELFFSCGNQDLTDSLIEALVAMLYLGTLKIDYSSLATIADHGLDSAARNNSSVLLSIMRSLLPSLSMRCDDSKLPENSKSRLSCHRAAVKVVELLVQDLCAFTEQVDATVASSDLKPQPGCESNPPSPAQALPQAETELSYALKPTLPRGFATVIGVLQRVILSCPDKAPIRSVVSASISSVLRAMSSPLSHKKHGQELRTKHENVLLIRSAIDRFITFVTNIMKSSKVFHRSFSLEVGALLVRLPGVWFLGDATESAECIPTTVPYELLLTIFGRCRDIAPSVRSKALAAIATIIDDLGALFAEPYVSDLNGEAVVHGNFNGFPIELCQGLYRLIVETSLLESTPSSDNFVDTIKVLMKDEKAMTRMKAIRAYGTALSIKWPKLEKSLIDRSNLKDVETVSMLITDDDVDLFSMACSDSSVSVRKQAVDSITQLLLSRPVDAFLQDAWVTNVLPLVVDPEATVQQKVAHSIRYLVLDTCLEWVSRQRGHSVRDISRSLCGLGWIFCSKLVQAGLNKMLVLSIKELLRTGIISTNPSISSGKDSITIKELVSAMEFACTFTFEDRNNSVLDGSCDQDLVSHGGWVILDALVVNSLQKSDTQAADYNAGLLCHSDFVFRCWEAKMASKEIMGSSGDDVRVLRVLRSIVSENRDLRNSSRFNKICKYLVKHICGLNCGSTVVTAAINLVFCPLSIYIMETKQSANSSSDEILNESLHYAGQILDAAFCALRATVYGTNSEDNFEGLFCGASGGILAMRRQKELYDMTVDAVPFVNAAIFVIGISCFLV